MNEYRRLVGNDGPPGIRPHAFIVRERENGEPLIRVIEFGVDCARYDRMNRKAQKLRDHWGGAMEFILVSGSVKDDVPNVFATLINENHWYVHLARRMTLPAVLNELLTIKPVDDWDESDKEKHLMYQCQHARILQQRMPTGYLMVLGDG
jgi:hypothetical protein